MDSTAADGAPSIGSGTRSRAASSSSVPGVIRASAPHSNTWPDSSWIRTWASSPDRSNPSSQRGSTTWWAVNRRSGATA